MGDFFHRRGKTGRSRLINEEENEDSEAGRGQQAVSYGATTTLRGRSGGKILWWKESLASSSEIWRFRISCT